MFKAKKTLGQNFLVNRGILDKIITAAELDKNDTVLEIGPGTGILTEKLAQEAGRVIAIEKDGRLTDQLKEKFRNSNVEVVEGDVLKLDIEKLIENCKLSRLCRGSSMALPSGKIENSDYKVIGNIPYYITSHLLKTIFEKWPMPELVVLMVQKEVAQRIMAEPPHMNLLALSVQFFAEPKIISYVSRGSFRPIPKVDSAIIRLTPTVADKKSTRTDADKFFKLIKTAFAGKRKQLKNTIGAEILKNTGIRPKSRPEKLSLENWLKIASEV